MSFYEASAGFLYLLATALLYPVIVALVLLFAWSLTLLGSLIQEYTSRHRDLKGLEEISQSASEMSRSGKGDLAGETLRSYTSQPLLSRVLEEMAETLGEGTFPFKAEKILQEAELKMAKALEPVRIGVRTGPMLGLMGTLIPMGPALIGLSKGDVQTMADNLVIAFATTVIGLVVGGVCYGAMVVRTRWYRQDLSDLEYAADIIRRGLHGAK